MSAVPGPQHGEELIRRPFRTAPGKTPWAVYVYEAPVRLWHWVTVVCMLVLVVTGILIGMPPPSIGGEAHEQYLFGYIRMAHFIAGQLLAVFFLLRVYWAFIGNEFASEVFLPPLHRWAFWKGLLQQIAYYLFILPKPRKHLGHNELAGFAMLFMCMLPLAFMIVTGFALYAEGQGMDHWMFSAFGWVIPLFGGSFVVHTLHHIGMWVLITFSAIHIYMVFREDVMGRTGIMSSMVGGWRFMKDDEP
jgi:Ni/Fe-hydrogenase 1 B-type cytochrome subunit